MTFQLTPEEQGLASRFDIAFAHCGIAWSDRRFQCPHCGPSAEPKKTKIFSDGGCICYKCRWGARDAYGILYRWSEERGRKYSFREAKAILMGFDPDSGKLVVSAETLAEVPQIEDDPDTVVDTEVLVRIKQLGNLAAAQRFWAAHHIDPAQVRWHASVRITRPYNELVGTLVSEFGEDRLIEAGVGIHTKEGKFWTVFGPPRDPDRYAPDWPICQFYLDPETGLPVGMELRGNEYVAKRSREHEEWKKNGRVGPKKPYIRKTTNLIGNAPGSRPGFGLWHVAQTPPGTVVWLVEGFKDMLASWTLGQPAIGLAGTHAEVDPRVIEVLRTRIARVAFDGDEAGAEGGAKLRTYLEGQGLTVDPEPVPLPEGKDICDMLAIRHKRDGCDCQKKAKAEAA